ncbi:MAG TPA: TIR domain-containing protein [Vitreimonas sp.]|uniref:TIR domain-containing protein n=1 Tax=Vitreimonas sp. TaxID=3069702 RepID=UPI002D5F6F2E|nr:TIR domain-containing protein [Vitreimonas sp.]HYD89380.1 TIR domain-containing protein [Vitreimonas sp.]
MADVFISYAREDREHAQRIAHGLASIGLDPFWDNEIPPGQTWADYIEGKLSGCKAAIVLWSAHSTRSQSVREEARIARDKSRLIPVLIENVQLPFGFGEVQCADLTQWRGDYADPAWTKFAQAVYAAARGETAPRTSAWTPPQPALQTAAFAGATASAHVAVAAEPSPIHYVQKCLRLYANGKGRAGRAEYWWWALFAVLALIVAGAIDLQFGVDFTGAPINPYFTGAVWLGLLAPGISVTARRLHDIGHSGWLAAAVVGLTLLGMALSGDPSPIGPLISLAAVGAAIVVGVISSAPGMNQYGPHPKGL